MNYDFTPDNIEFWIDNWKRKHVINSICKAWLDSFPFTKINIIVNNSTIDENVFDESIRDRLKLWKNVMRHDVSRGPITKNINQAYIHTFLSKKKYCVFIHDDLMPREDWFVPIINSDYHFYMVYCDQFQIQTVKGLQSVGWWDERYATLGWHEIDYMNRAWRASQSDKSFKTSLIDAHAAFPHEYFVDGKSYNSVGLENYMWRLDHTTVPQIGPTKNQYFSDQQQLWNKIKWQGHAPWSKHSLDNGPSVDEINWYPWLNLNDMDTDTTSITQ